MDRFIRCSFLVFNWKMKLIAHKRSCDLSYLRILAKQLHSFLHDTVAPSLSDHPDEWPPLFKDHHFPKNQRVVTRGGLLCRLFLFFYFIYFLYFKAWIIRWGKGESLACLKGRGEGEAWYWSGLAKVWDKESERKVV